MNILDWPSYSDRTAMHAGDTTIVADPNIHRIWISPCQSECQNHPHCRMALSRSPRASLAQGISRSMSSSKGLNSLSSDWELKRFPF
jgi:hypothetical protein